jgi:hypothetical protein
MGITSIRPLITSDPCCFQRVSCWEMKESWLILASICLGPYIRLSPRVGTSQSSLCLKDLGVGHMVHDALPPLCSRG